MSNGNTGKKFPDRGFSGKLADPAVRAERARKASEASKAAATPEGRARKLLERLDEVTPGTRAELRHALVLMEMKEALAKIQERHGKGELNA
jgi:hypothetical protein